MEQKVLLLLLLAALANAGPLTSRHRGGGCALSCPRAAQPPAYSVGRAYTFDYSTDMRAHIRGATEESAGLQLSARVVFDFLAPCEVAMRLSNIRVQELDPAGEAWLDSPQQARFEQELTASDAHFAFANGLVGDVCAEVAEPDWVLNIKKAMIGLLQNSNTEQRDGFEGVETDISGRCKVTYNVQQDSSKGASVTKVTDLMSCPDQQKVRSSFQSSSYRTSARIQSMPLTRANRTCRAQYDTSGHLKSSVCSEEHLFRPFSTETAGAVTTVQQKMTFVGTGGIVRIAHDHVFQRSKLEYQHHDFKQTSENPVENVRSVLSSLCDLGTAIGPKTPVLFNELIYRLKELTTEQLVTMRRDVEGFSVCRRNNQMAKQFFFDALPAVTTPAAVQMMNGLIASGQVSNTEADAWLTSLAFVQDPSKEMLESLLPLLQVEEPRTQAQLGITAVVNQYCSSRTRCETETVVKSVGAALQRLIGSDCSTGDRRTLLVALKAIGNAGHLTELLPNLARCANKESNLMEVRVAAIEALRRTPCSVDRRPLLRLIRNMDLDSELRITAYLGLMACPTIEVFDTVRELLTAESSNQFASFMWTHLTNLLETSDPHKQDIRLIVEDVKLKKQYDMDKLKFSRNIEKSFFSNYLNAGAKVESNLIWSQKSFLPRSATLNMTLDLFGKSLNFLEVGGRVQGMEVLLEKYLGPKSNKSNETDTNTQLAQLDETFKLIEEKIGGNLDIKIFGHQVAFLDLWKEDMEISGSNILKLLNSLRQMREINWYKSISFLDTQVTIPTISGFPLRLGINGTASFILKAKSKVNLKKLMQWPPEFEVEGQLVPSGAVHVSGMLGINTVFGDYGVKMVSNVYSSTEMQASIKAANGEELKVEINQPRQRQNILNAKTSFFIVRRSVEREQNMRRDLTVNRKSCSGGGFLQKVLGIEFCSEIRYPSLPAEDAPQAPLVAGFELDLSMLKKDTHESFVLHLINRKEGINRHWKALVDMPGSKSDRKIQAEVKIDSDSRKAEAILETPWKKGKAEISLISGADGKEMKILAEMDGVTYASATTRYNLVATSEQLRVDLTQMEIRLLNSRPIILKGTYGFSKAPARKNWELSATVENLLTRPVGVNTHMSYENGLASALANISSPVFSGRVESNYNIARGSVSGSTTVGYKFGDESEQTVKIEPAIKFAMTSEDRNIRSSVKTTFSNVPQFNIYVSLVFKSRMYPNHELELRFEDANNEITRLYSKYDIGTPSSGHEHKLDSFFEHRGYKQGIDSVLVHDLAWTDMTFRLICNNEPRSPVSTTLKLKREPGNIFYTASLKSDLIGDVVSKLENFPEKGTIVFESTLSVLETDYRVQAELLQKDSKHKVSGSLKLPYSGVVSAELSADTSSSEPYIAARLSTPSVTYSANATGKFDYQSADMNARINAPGVDVQGKLQVSSEESKNRLLAELYWNPRRQQTDGLRIDGEFETKRQAHLLERTGRLEISVPMGAIAIRLNERNEPLKSNKYIELQYAEGKKVSANFVYDINDGWTEKGIVAMLRVETPFNRYEDITLKLDGYGSLRVRKLQIESIVNGRRFKADLLVNLGNINNFHSRLSIVTPWAHVSFMKFELNHWLTSSEIKSKLDVDLKTEKIVIVEVHGYSRGAYSGRDVGLSLQSNSTLNWFPKLLLDVTHKDDLEQFSSSFKIATNNRKDIDLISRFDFYPSRYGVESRGNISLATSVPGYETLAVIWSHKHNRQIVKTSSKLSYKPGKSMLINLDGYDETTAGLNRQMGVDFLVSAPFMDDLKLKTSAKSANRIEANAQLKVPSVGDYQADFQFSKAGRRMHFKVETPHASLPRFGMICSERQDGDSNTEGSTEIYWGNELIKLTSKMLAQGSTKTSEIVLQTPFDAIKRERLVLEVTNTYKNKKFAMELNHMGEKVFGMSLRRQDRDAWVDHGLVVETASEWMRSVKISSEYLWEQNEKQLKASAVYNEAYTSFLEFSKATQSTEETIKFEVNAQSPHTSQGLSFTTKSSGESRNSLLIVTIGRDRKVTINTIVDRRDGTFELEARTPFAVISRLKMNFSVGEENGERWIGMTAKHDCYSEFRMIELQGRLGGWKKASLDIKLNLPRHWQADTKLVLNHLVEDTDSSRNGLSTIELQYPGGGISGSSEFKIAADEVSGTFKILTPFWALEELQLHSGSRTASRFVDNSHGFKVKSFGNRIQLLNNVKQRGWESFKLSSKLESNLAGWESVKISAHQTIDVSSSTYDAALKLESPTVPEFSTGLNWKLDSPGFEGNFYTKTEFEQLKELNVTVQMSYTDSFYWTAKSKIDFLSDLGGRKVIKNELAFRGLTMAAGFSVANSETSLAANLKAEALRRDAVEIEGKLNAWGDKKAMQLTLEKPSPAHFKGKLELSGIPTISAEARLFELSRSLRHEISVLYGETQVLKNSLQYGETAGANGLVLSVNTTVIDFKQESGLELKLDSGKLSLDAKHKCNWLRGPVTLKFEAEKRSTGLAYLSANANFQWPYSDPATMSFLLNLEHAKKGVAEFDLRIPTMNRICYGVTWNFLTNIAGTISIELPYVGGIESKLSAEGNELLVMLEMPRILSDKWELRISGTASSPTRAQLNFRLLTSLPNFREISINHVHNLEDDNQLTSELMLPGWTKKARLHFSISENKITVQVDGPGFHPVLGELFARNGPSNFEVKLMCRWNAIFGNHDLEVRTKLTHSYLPATVSVEAKLPLKLLGYEDSAKFKLEGEYKVQPTTAFNVELQMALSDSRPMSQLVKLTYGKVTGKRIFTITVPTMMSASISQEGTRTEAAVTIGDLKMELSQQTNFNSLNDFEVLADAKLTGASTSQVEFHLRHQGHWRRFNNRLNVKLDMTSVFDYEGQFGFDLNRALLKTKFSMETPITDRMFLSLGHHGPLWDFSQHLELSSKYHTPIVYKGRYSDADGEFEATLPRLGEAKIQLKRAPSKNTVTVLVNRIQMLQIEKEQLSSGGKLSIRIDANGFKLAAKLEGHGNTRWYFERAISVTVNNHVVEFTGKHIFNYAAGFSAKYTQARNPEVPVHLIDLNYRLNRGDKPFFAGITLVKNYETLLSVEAKASNVDNSGLASLTLRTSLQGLHYTSLSGSLTLDLWRSGVAELKLNNDYTRENKITLEFYTGAETGSIKASFDGAYLGKHSIQFSQIKRNKLDWAMSEVIELKSGSLDSITLTVYRAYSFGRAMELKVQLKTPFEGARTSTLTVNGNLPAPEGSLLLRLDQEYLGTHELKSKISAPPGQISVAFEIISDIDSIDKTKFEFDFVRYQVKASFSNQIVGTMVFDSRAEMRPGAASGRLVIQAPWNIIGTSAFSFKWRNINKATNLELTVRTPIVGENFLKINKAEEKVGDTEVQSIFDASVYLEKLNERLSLRSRFSSKLDNSFSAEGRHQVQSSRLGAYSLSEEEQVFNNKVFARVTVKTPFDTWDKSTFTYDFETEGSARKMTVRLDTKLYGMQDLTFRVNDNELTGHITVLSIRNELTIIGWRPQRDSNGAMLVDFFASVSSPFMKASTRVGLKRGHFSAMVSTEVQSRTATATTSATWEIKPKRLLLDVAANAKVSDIFSQAWGAMCDLDLANETVKRLVVKLVAPLKSIETTELAVTFKKNPLIDASVLIQSPFFGNVKVKGMWHAPKGLLVAPISAKFRVDSSIEFVPKFEASFDHVQKHEHVICEFGLMSLSTGKFVFKADSVLDAFNKKMQVNLGVNRELSFKWQSKSDLSEGSLDERVVAVLNQRDKYSAKAVYNWKNDRTVLFKVTTPFPGYEKLGMKLVAQVSMPFDVTAKLMLPNQELKAQAVLDLTDGLHARVALKLPGLPDVELAFQTAGSLKNYKFELTTQYGTKRFSVLTNWDLSVDKQFRVKLETPVEDLRLAELYAAVYGNMDAKRSVKLRVAFNDYANELKLSRESNEKGMKLRVHYPGRLVEMKMSRSGHDVNKVLQIVLEMNKQKLVDVSTKLQSMFSAERWSGIRLPHSGFVRVNTLFGTALEQSAIEWDYRRMVSSASGLHDLSLLLKVAYKESNFNYEMSMLHDGKFQVRTSLNLPEYAIRLDEVSASVQITGYGNKEKRVVIDVSHLERKVKLTCITNLKDSIQVHLNGINGLTSFISKDSLALQTHFVQTNLIGEISFRLSGLRSGELKLMLSAKKEKAFNVQLAVSAEAFARSVDGHLLVKSRQGWLSSATEHSLEGRLSLFSPVMGSCASKWTAKLKPGVLEADLNVATGMASENQLLSSKLSVSYENNRYAKVEFSGFGVNGEVASALRDKQWDLTVKSGRTEVASIMWSVDHSGYYRTRTSTHRLNVLYNGQVVLGFESKQEVVNWDNQYSVSAKLEVAGKALKTIKFERKGRTFDVNFEWDQLSPLKLEINCDSLLRPKIAITFGALEALAHMNLLPSDGTYSAEFKTANPWLPINVRLNHIHRAYHHKILHELEFGRKKYTLDSSAILTGPRWNAKLHCTSPTKSLKLTSHASYATRTGSFSNTIEYNGVTYLQLDGNLQENVASPEKGYESMSSASVQLSTGEHRYRRYLPPIRVSLQHHCNNAGWRDTAWSNQASLGEWKVTHTGKIDAKNQVAKFRLTGLGHENVLKFDRRSFLVQHTAEGVNVLKLSAKCDKTSSELQFNSDWTSFHTNAKFGHDLRGREGSVTMEQTGSFETPKLTASWSLKLPSLRADLNIGGARMQLRHEHRSNADFSCHHSFTNGPVKHEFKAKFAVKPSTRSEYRVEVVGTAELTSTSIRTLLSASFQHHHNSWLEHSCAAKLHAGDWKLLHKSVMAPGLLETENYIHRGSEALYEGKLNWQAGVLIAESKFNGVSLCRVEMHCANKLSSIKLSSPRWGVDSQMKFEHDFENWRQSKFTAELKGRNANFKASTNWHFSDNSKRFYASLFTSMPVLEIDLSSNKADDGVAHFRHKASFATIKLQASGVYDGSSAARLTETTLVFEQSFGQTASWMWSHRFRRAGFVKLLYSHGSSGLQEEKRLSWNFNSPGKSSFEIQHPNLRLNFAQHSATSGRFSTELSFPTGQKQSLAGVLEAAATWKSGEIKLNSSGLVYAGSWNLDGAEKSLNLDVRSFKLNLRHNQRDARSFDFNHRMTCVDCPSYTWVPEAFAISGSLTAPSSMRVAKLTASVAVNNDGPLPVEVSWNLDGEQFLAEISAQNLMGRFAHRHASWTNFDFNHTLVLLGTAQSAVGGLKIEPSTEFRKRLVAHFNALDQKINFDHAFDGLHRHRWNHRVQLLGRHLVSTGHRYAGESLMAQVRRIDTEPEKQILLTWKPNQFESRASLGSRDVLRFKYSLESADKSALFKIYNPWWSSSPYVAEATLRRTCPMCYRLTANASADGTKLGAVNADFQLPDRDPIQVNFSMETTFGKVELRNKIFGRKLSSFKYVGSIGTDSASVRVTLESQILSLRNATFNAAVHNINLIPLLNEPASFFFSHVIDAANKIEQSIQVRYGNGLPFAYRFSSELIPASRQLLRLLPANLNRKSVLSVNWLSGSFVEVQVNGPLSVSVTSSCPVVPAFTIKLQPRMDAEENTWDAEFRVADKVIKCSLTIDSRVLELRVQTPFELVRKLGGKVAFNSEPPMKLSAEASFELNDYRYAASVNADVKKVARYPQGLFSCKIQTPHRAIKSAKFLIEHRRSDELWSAEFAARINEKELTIDGNATNEAVRLRIALPIEGYEKVGFKVLTDQSESEPRVQALVHMPHGHFGRVSTVGSYNGPAAMSTRVSVESSFRGFRNAEIRVKNQMRQRILEHTSSMRVNGEQWHDIKIRAGIQSGQIVVNRTQPVVIGYKVTMTGEMINSEIKVNIGEWVPFHLRGQVQASGEGVKSRSFLSLRTPHRTVQLDREISLFSGRLGYKLSFTPNQGVVRPLSFEASLENKGVYSEVDVESKLALSTPARRIESTIGYQKKTGEFRASATVNWDANDAESNKILGVSVQGRYTPGRQLAGTAELRFIDPKPYSVSISTERGVGKTLHSTDIRLDITKKIQDTIVLKWSAVQKAPESTQLSASLSQASSNVDFRINGEMTTTSEVRSGNLSIHYTDAGGRPTVMQSVVELSSSALRVDLVLPTKRCSLELKKTVKLGATTYTAKTHGQKLEVRVSSQPDLQLIYEPRENDRFSAALGYADDWHLRADVHRVTNQVKMQQLLAQVQLKSRNLMKVKLHWNPTSSLLRYAALRESLPALLNDGRALMASMKASCVYEILAQVRNDLILPDLSSAANSVAQELEPLRRDLGYMNAQFRDMYIRNEFYSRDIYEAVREVTRAVVSRIVGAAQSAMDAYSAYVHPHVVSAANRIASHASRCYGHATRVYAVYQHHRDRLYRKVNGHALRFINSAVDGIRPALDAAHSGYQRFAAVNPLSGSAATLGDLRMRVARSVSEVNYEAFNLLHSDIREQVLTAHRSIEASIGRASDSAAVMITSAKARVRHHVNRMVGDGLLSSMASGAYTQSRWFLDHFNIEQNLKDFARDNYLQGVEYLRQNTIGLATDYLGLSKNAIIENNFKQGKFEAHFYSPMKWKDLKTPPSSGLEEVQGRLENSYKSARNSFNTVRRKLTAVRDVVYDSIPDFDMPSGSWIPKFKGVASVIGDHFVTFDGRHFDFRGSGECGYLLARDFRGRGWAVGLTYGRSGKSLDIFAYGKRIRVTPRLHVLVDGAQQELPLNIGDLSIVRTGSGLRAKDLGHLFTITVDPEADTHTVSVSGWYHGRLGGLFGNFDNEPFNDLISSRGRRSDAVLDFTGSWRLGACRHANLASIIKVPERVHTDCLDLFESPRSSPFRRCYSFVDPAPFRDICAQERRTGGAQQVCRAAVAYIRHCDAKGLRGLRAPAKCLSCNTRGDGYRQLALGQSHRLRAPDAVAADIVLVLEERGCIGRETLRRLPRLVAQVKSSLSTSGVSDIRFGLLGFGNPAHLRGKAVATERSRPHWHTLAGELMGSEEQLLRALDAVETHNTADASVDGARGSDALEAVRLAARLGELRPEASRHVILVACDECHEGRRTLQSVRQSLLESGVRLHLLTEEAMPTYFFGRRSQAFGVDSGKAFSLESPEGSAELHGFTRRPAGKCGRLAAESGGSVFDLRFLRRRQYAGGRAELFGRVFADRLAAEVAAESASGLSGGFQECRCSASGCGTRGRLTCRPL